MDLKIIKLLLLEDEVAHSEAIRRALKSSSMHFEVRVVGTLQEYREAVATYTPDIVLLDMVLPDGRSLELLISPPEANFFPMLIMTSHGDEKTAVEAMKGGALDYIVKSSETISDMPHIVVRALHHWKLLHERRRADAALRESEAKYRSLVETAGAGVASVNTEGILTFINDKVCQMTGRSGEDILGKRFTEFLHSDDLPGLTEMLIDAVSGGSTGPSIEFRIIHKDGKITWLYSNPTRITLGGKTVGFNAIMYDITQHKEAEKTIEKQREEYRTIYDSVRPMIVYLTKDGVIQRINKSGAAFFGLEPREIVGKTVYDFLPASEADQFTTENNEVISSGKAKLAIIQEYSRLSGKKRWAQIDRIPYLDERGDIIGVITFHMDITRRKSAEEALQQSLAALEKTLDDAIGAMSKIVEMKDPFTAGHQVRVAQLAIAMAEKMNLTDEQVGYIKTAATVHDIGKIYVPSDILSKPGNLRDMEMQIIRTHAQGSYDILRKINFHGPMAQIAYQHHERLDGSGYPLGLKGNDIIVEAKILAVADVVEAMASHRPYRAALGIDKALEEIRMYRGSKYDEAAVDACLELFNDGRFEFNPA